MILAINEQRPGRILEKLNGSHDHSADNEKLSHVIALRHASCKYATKMMLNSCTFETNKHNLD